MKRVIKIVLFCLPFLIGLIGFALAGEATADAVFNSVLLYLFNYGDTPANLWVEIARWVAPVATASGIISLIVTYATAVKNRMRNLKSDSVAVYGDSDEARMIKEQLKDRLIVTMDDGFVEAKRYVLLNSEEENLRFYLEHRDKLKSHPVCIQCSNLASQDLAGDLLKPFNAEETAARLFWKNSGIYELAKSCNYQMNIAIIGFGRLGQELLLKGLQYNIFSSDQKLCYHVYGDSTEFCRLYHQISHMEDPILFHDDWTQDMENLQRADMIILAEQENEISSLRKLTFALAEKEIHVLSTVADLMNLFDARNRLHVFDWKREVFKLEYLFEDKLFQTAKRINLRYAYLYGGVEETAKNAEIEWKKLDSFTKYSNVSSADYHEVREKMLAEWNAAPTGENLSEDQKEQLAILEHMRWSRYHYLSNWSYGVPENGKAKDAKKRIHVDLIPYEELSEGEKQKDRDTIGVMLGLADKLN